MSIDPQILAPGRRPEATSRWVPLLEGRVTASGCPSRAKLAMWADRGATDVVTLQRADEMPEWLAQVCEDVGLRWHAYPLSGRRLERREDHETLARLPLLLEPLRVATTGLVLHCAAGMHRTGLCLYLLMRHAGLDRDQALALIEEARPITARELCRTTKRSGRLLDRAESLLESGPLGER